MFLMILRKKKFFIFFSISLCKILKKIVIFRVYQSNGLINYNASVVVNSYLMNLKDSILYTFFCKRLTIHQLHDHIHLITIYIAI
jgi:hypothetical protein